MGKVDWNRPYENFICPEHGPQKPTLNHYKDPNKNPGRECRPCANRRASERIRQARLETLAAYGNKCACCGEEATVFLSIDHIKGDGAAHRRERKNRNIYYWLRERNYPKNNFQILCRNCNWAKGQKKECPHAQYRREQKRLEEQKLQSAKWSGIDTS